MVELSLVQKVVIWSLPLLFGITVHEVAHGWVASKCGDQTARLSGRLTLNPLKHIDLLGTIIVPLFFLVMTGFVFGWARPVPVDPRNFRHRRRDNALVAAAGPVSNFLMALVWAALAKGGQALLMGNNTWLGNPLYMMGVAGVWINCVLGVLNLIPFPPLDGSKIIYSLLPGRWVWQLQRIEPYSFLILMLLWITGYLFYFLTPAIFLVQKIAILFGLGAI